MAAGSPAPRCTLYLLGYVDAVQADEEVVDAVFKEEQELLVPQGLRSRLLQPGLLLLQARPQLCLQPPAADQTHTRLYGCPCAETPQKCCKSCPGRPTLWSGCCLHYSSSLAGRTCPPHALLGQARSERHLQCMASGPAITMALDRRTSPIPPRSMSLLSQGGLWVLCQDQTGEHPAERRPWCRRGGQLSGTETGWPVGTRMSQCTHGRRTWPCSPGMGWIPTWALRRPSAARGQQHLMAPGGWRNFSSACFSSKSLSMSFSARFFSSHALMCCSSSAVDFCCASSLPVMSCPGHSARTQPAGPRGQHHEQEGLQRAQERSPSMKP